LKQNKSPKSKRQTMHQDQHKGWSTKYLNLVHHAIEFSNNLRTQQTTPHQQWQPRCDGLRV
ncbi:hypothetical protein ACN4EB_08240, partial [Corynebacterium macclintockiae]|uniref:hypothetical protein n=1 Tax=Corynebacterium macclintockiae TaxID=2913501 RepID=UPI003EC14248